MVFTAVPSRNGKQVSGVEDDVEYVEPYRVTVRAGVKVGVEFETGCEP
jgi:hypothetical protein